MVVFGVGRFLYDTFLRPAEAIASRGAVEGGHGRIDRLRRLFWALRYLAGNAALFVVPAILPLLVDIAGSDPGIDDVGPQTIGIPIIGPVVYDPQVVGPIVRVTVLAVAAFLVAAGVFLAVTVVLFHAGLRVTGNARGFVTSIETVAFGFGTYLITGLSVLFLGVRYTDTGFTATPSVELVSDLLVNYVIVGIARGLFSSQQARALDPLVFPASLAGQLIVAGTFLAFGYYAYSVYLAARVHHGAGTASASIVTGFALLAPVTFAPLFAARATTGGRLFLFGGAPNSIPLFPLIAATVIAFPLLLTYALLRSPTHT